ncbi:hypothetical protein J4411_01200 [Candidatus Pacearchaeota archaeon]|nr:hypothetical protein [uncultured archaeon]MBS3084511.1 hypothetical protein [Candidatus Pacearchaeota archaeon]
MVYELSLEKLKDISTRIPGIGIICKRYTTETNRLIFEESTYFEACSFLKSKEIPEDWPKIKEAETLYKQGKIHEANRLIYDLWEDLNFLNSINEKDIKYYGN